MESAMTAIMRDASGKMHHGILFDPPLTTDRQKDNRQTDRQTDKQTTGKETNRPQTDRYTGYTQLGNTQLHSNELL